MSGGAAKKVPKSDKGRGVASIGSALGDGGSTAGPTTAAPRFSVEPQGTVIPQPQLLPFIPG